MSSGWHEIRGQDVLLRLRIQPRASRDAIEGIHGDRLRVRVSAPPVDDAANDRLILLLARTLDMPRSSVQLVRGARGRDKDVLLSGAAPRLAEVVRRLAPGTG